MDDMTKSAQQFEYDNLVRKKQKEIEEVKMHAKVKRQQFERKEKKMREKEIEMKEDQMRRLELERSGLKDEYAIQEEKIKKEQK